MSLYLGVDYGLKRIGLAVGDATTGVASPHSTVPATGVIGSDVQAVLKAAAEFAFARIVVGLPLNMDGTEGEQAKRTRRFGTALAKRSKLPVVYWDERLSSVAAGELMAENDLSRKKRKARRDPVAATVILQEYMDRERDGDG